VRYKISSLKTPQMIIDYDMTTSTSTMIKRRPVLNYNADQFITEYVQARARDGVQVPVSLVYRRGLKRDGSAPCYLFGYGAYGSNYDAAFTLPLVTLLERGFVCGIAHVRGGMEMGAQWYDAGKMLHKRNTFTDFIDCATMLCNERYTSADRLFASGRSAGGLLMAAVANMRPDLFKGILIGVPFIDVLTTMGDASIPVTTFEYQEWGNPAIQREYDYMRSYSPYDNIERKQYTNMLVQTSLSDSQVQYFEPAKYVAKLRALKTDNNLLLLRTDMSGSHSGSSGRFTVLKDRALEYAWMLGLLNDLFHQATVNS
jgi:oligopeptidase B